jgi:hypothetical protein
MYNLLKISGVFMFFSRIKNDSDEYKFDDFVENSLFVAILGGKKYSKFGSHSQLREEWPSGRGPNNWTRLAGLIKLFILTALFPLTIGCLIYREWRRIGVQIPLANGELGDASRSNLILIVGAFLGIKRSPCEE